MQKGQVQIILIGILVIAVLVGGAYYLGKQTTSKPQNSVVTSVSPTPAPDETANWKTYKSQYMSFQYPTTWSPTQSKSFGGITVEALDLNIPGILGTTTGDDTIGFYAPNYDGTKPSDAISSQPINISGKQGMKWIRKGQYDANINGEGGKSFVAYDYATIGYKNSGTFSVHVMLSTEDKNLEKQLDQLVKSVKFTQ